MRLSASACATAEWNAEHERKNVCLSDSSTLISASADSASAGRERRWECVWVDYAVG